MSNLNIERKSVYEVFTKRGLKFLIPDYQRPYSWTLEHCETLFEDLKESRRVISKAITRKIIATSNAR